MSAPAPVLGPVSPDTLITVKVLFRGQNRRFKLAIRDLGAHLLPQKLRVLLMIPLDQEVRFERYSDSAGSYVSLDGANPAVYKQLYRAAKAKLKLRLKATIVDDQVCPTAEASKPEQSVTSARLGEIRANTFFDTVLARPNMDIPSEPKLKPSTVEDIQAIHERLMQIPLSRPTLPTLNDFCGTTFSIDCNACGRSVASEHFHCSKCELGDFDLCPACIGQGVTCNGEDHWLIKRTINCGKVITSNTETLPPKQKAVLGPTATVRPDDTVAPTSDEDQRTCNSCIIQLVASSFVTCRECADYDLCFFCLEQGQHGHHPSHTFEPVDSTSPSTGPYIKRLCQPGRGLRHEAVCDGCDSPIHGVRHKCLSCPDFDYCSTCVLVTPEVHPGHRFAPIYEQLAPISNKKEQHRSIYCDGPICSARARKTYIRGDRYKCTICHDTDFCANCEALPTNTHNKTHPLIKIKTAVHGLHITTVEAANNGQVAKHLGDRPQSKHASTETLVVPATNAATQVQTVAETKPVEHKPVSIGKSAEDKVDLNAHFVAETTPDGSVFAPNRLIHQSWTLHNPGPTTWPVGCAIHFIGGEDMRNLSDKHPSPVSSMILASVSNNCAVPVRPGESFTFTVTLKSPAREGRAVSYWRMKTLEGMPFGHKLWCDITVSDPSSTTVETPAMASIEAATEKKDSVESNSSSQMIFPKLDKESPESSVNDIKQELVAVDPSVASEDQELVDDLDSMALEEEETDDGFFTDEEYDILDAEEEEDLINAQRAAH